MGRERVRTGLTADDVADLLDQLADQELVTELTRGQTLSTARLRSALTSNLKPAVLLVAVADSAPELLEAGIARLHQRHNSPLWGVR